MKTDYNIIEYAGYCAECFYSNISLTPTHLLKALPCTIHQLIKQLTNIYLTCTMCCVLGSKMGDGDRKRKRKT